MKKLILTAAIFLQMTCVHAGNSEKYLQDATFWAQRLNNSVVYQFLYNDAIEGGITDAEYAQLKATYTEESKMAEVTLDAYKQVLLLKNETDNQEFKKFISDLVNDNKLTHFEVDLIIQKYRTLI